jgi:hypothetical protein
MSQASVEDDEGEYGPLLISALEVSHEKALMTTMESSMMFDYI